MNELLHDLEALFVQRSLVMCAKDKKDPSAIDELLFKRHALIWYDGDIDKSSERYQTFKKKVQLVIEELSTNMGNLKFDWPNKISNIDECHLEEESITYLNALDTKDIVRHWMNGGTQYGVAKNIHKQMRSKEFQMNMEKAIEQSTAQIVNRAKKRWLAGGN